MGQNPATKCPDESRRETADHVISSGRPITECRRRLELNSKTANMRVIKRRRELSGEPAPCGVGSCQRSQALGGPNRQPPRQRSRLSPSFRPAIRPRGTRQNARTSTAPSASATKAWWPSTKAKPSSVTASTPLRRSLHCWQRTSLGDRLRPPGPSEGRPDLRAGNFCRSSASPVGATTLQSKPARISYGRLSEIVRTSTLTEDASTHLDISEPTLHPERRLRTAPSVSLKTPPQTRWYGP